MHIEQFIELTFFHNFQTKVNLFFTPLSISFSEDFDYRSQYRSWNDTFDCSDSSGKLTFILGMINNQEQFTYHTKLASWTSNLWAVYFMYISGINRRTANVSAPILSDTAWFGFWEVLVKVLAVEHNAIGEVDMCLICLKSVIFLPSLCKCFIKCLLVGWLFKPECKSHFFVCVCVCFFFFFF